MQDLVKANCIVLFLVLLASAIYKTFCEVPNFRNKTFNKANLRDLKAATGL